MKKRFSSPAIDCRLVVWFESARRKLLELDLAERGDKPLGFWAQPGDRHLPLALVDRKVREVLAAEFDDLHATPGIGPKKLTALIMLLQRAALPEPPAEPTPAPVNGAPAAACVCEAVWEQWRAGVLAQGLGRETLGRFAASLQDLPRSLWRTTLDHYAGLTLSEIKRLKAHGEKRVSAVVDIFGHVHQIASQLDGRPHLRVRIVPKLVEQIESWAQRRLNDPASIEADELRAAIVVPLVQQVANDAGESTARIAECRLFPQVQSVQRIARQLGLTRGRVYELLADVDTIVDVRWPEGRSLARRLAERIARDAASSESSPASTAAELLESAAQLFFPTGQLSMVRGQLSVVNGQ
jgi:hypothetical protein